MPRLTSALCGIALLTAGSAALAAEPVQLTDHELDSITAGVDVGAGVIAVVAVDGQVFPFDDIRFDSGPLNREVAVGSANGVAEAQIGGNVTVTDSGLFKTALGFFGGQTRTEGTGQAAIGAETVIVGGTPVINTTSSFSLGNETYFVTMIAAFN